MTSAAKPKPKQAESSIKETIISMIISLAMALVAKSYVIEAFVIPTGSMAPTLLGKHMLFQSPSSGYSWTVNPWYYLDPDVRNFPAPVQGDGGTHGPLVTDPMSTSRINQWFRGQLPSQRAYGFTLPPAEKPARAGDRILVQKYLYEIFPPKRFDVVVFKNPEDARDNFIKRLIGLPDEQVWLADGDVFARPRTDAPTENEQALHEGWTVQRKPDRIQRSLWRTVYSSEFAPLELTTGAAPWFKQPWLTDGFQTTDARVYTTSGPEPAILAWNLEDWPITNWVSYNEIGLDRSIQSRLYYPVGDIRIRAGIRPDGPGLAATPLIRAAGHEFRADLRPDAANPRRYDLRIERRPIEPANAPWELMASDTVNRAVFAPGRTTAIEFWHADQALSLWIDDRKALSAEYDIDPVERLRLVTGEDVSAPDLPSHFLYLGDNPTRYDRHIVGADWTLSGSGATLMRVGLDRDIYYEPARYNAGSLAAVPALGTHPANLATLNSDQFFVCGDNSPYSKDGRLWDRVDPWVANEIDPTMGVVARRLMLGKAFYVYFPAPYSHGRIGSRGIGRFLLGPDIGRMRFIK